MTTRTDDMPEHLKAISGPLLHAAPDTSDFTDRAESSAAALGFRVFHVDLSGVPSKRELLRRFAAAMSFPSYFGENWDALLDCLRDLSWIKSAGYILVVKGIDERSETSPTDARTLVEVIASAAQYWRDRRCPFFAVLVTASAGTALPSSVEICHHA